MLLKFGTQFDHATAEVLQTEVQGQGVKDQRSESQRGVTSAKNS